jgi:hypothetical protein
MRKYQRYDADIIAVVFDDDRYSISRLYRELGCQHHLVQAQDDQRPEIPSLTPVGFQRWATLLLQAHPDEEYERLQKAVLDMPISNPDEKKERFPKECSRRLFPDSADFGIRERLQKAISKHAEVDFGTRAEGSPPRRPSTGTDSIYTSAASRQPSLSVETSSVPPTHRREPSTNNEPTRPSALGGTSIERERAPYANTPTEAVIDDTYPPPGLSKPLERERKPYSAVPGGGRAYDDDDGNAKPPRAESVSSKMGQLNSGAKTRPLSMGVMGPRAMDGAKSEFPPHHQPPNTTRRRRSPSFSQANNDFRRSDNDTRGYIPPYQASPGPVADAYDDESRRYSRDRVRRPVDDSGRDYGDSAWTRYERGPYVTEEDYGRGDARSRGGGYDYTPAGYGGPGYRS